MEQSQILGLVRVLLSSSGPVGAWVLTTWGSKWGITAAQLDAIYVALITAIGALPPLISAIWTIVSQTRSAKIKAVAAMPEVSRVDVRPVDSTMRKLIDSTDGILRKVGTSPSV